MRATFAAVFLLAAGCGSSGTTVAPTSSDSDSVLQAEPSIEDGLALRIAGPVEGGLLCPGGRRPCLPFESPTELGTDGSVLVSGQLLDGVFVVNNQHSLPQRAPRDYSNQCPDQQIDGSPPIDVVEAMYEDPSMQPPGYADLWDSDDGVLHIGLADNPNLAKDFLNEIGLGDKVCLVTGFPYTDQVLETVQQAVVEAAQNHGLGGFGVSRDSWEGTVTIDVPQFDQEFRAQLDQISGANGGVPIAAEASVEVINGSLHDYETELASIGVNPDPGQLLTASCGPVVFTTVPPDLEEFPLLDDDARIALDELVNGTTAAEAGGFGRNYQWSIALRTDNHLILFGQGSDTDGPSWADVQFERRDGAWAPTNWGGCRIEISALGLGPATVATDPDHALDPSATELTLRITEQACANGESPVGREIVPLVTETDETVTVTVLVAPVEGGAACPGNPWHPITITLDSPLGSRQLLDGRQYPPQPVAVGDVID